MNAVLAFLEEQRDTLALERFGLTGRLSGTLLTPSFRASRHVVLIVTAAGGRRPALVVKVPRLAEDGDGVEREFEILQHVHAHGAVGGVPVPVMLARRWDRPLLVESALAGDPLTPSLLRRRRTLCLDATRAWLAQLPRDEPRAPAFAAALRALVDDPLARLGRSLPGAVEEAELIERTGDLLAPLREAALPLVVEHGDLSHPNLLLLEDGSVGVVDWELAEPRGLPAHDLVFFLAFAAFALARATTADLQLAAFHDAFAAPAGWARPVVLDYGRDLGIPAPLLLPLVVACWARYTVGLIQRVESTGPRPSDRWHRTDRHYLLWKHAVDHAQDLAWTQP